MRTKAEVYLDHKLCRIGIPNRAKVRAFSKRLEKETGCSIAWHWLIKQFVVTRRHNGRLYTYLVLKPEIHFPLTIQTLKRLKTFIGYADHNRAVLDAERAFIADMTAAKDEKTAAIKKHCDDWKPELESAMKYVVNKMQNGRHSKRVFAVNK